MSLWTLLGGTLNTVSKVSNLTIGYPLEPLRPKGISEQRLKQKSHKRRLNMSRRNLREHGLDFQAFRAMTFQEVLSYLLNTLALADRKVFLEEHPEDKGNGYYKRKLSAGSMTLDLDIPRTRSGYFRPFFLPEKWQRCSPWDYSALVFSLLVGSRSIEAAKEALKDLNLPVSEEYLARVVDEMREQIELLNASPLDSDWFALIADAKQVNLKVKDSILKHTVITVVGIDLEGRKRIVLCELFRGKERLEMWREAYRKLLERGVRRPLVVVHDDFGKLSEVTSSFFPGSDVQLCTVHLLRNARKHLSPEAFSRFKRLFESVKHAYNEEHGQALLQEMIEVAKESNSFAKSISKKRDLYLAFLRYPHEVRAAISSTNLVEGINRHIEDAEQMSGGYFHSEENLKFRLGVIVRRLHLGRWRKPHWKIASVSHILKEMLITRFEKNCREVQTQCS